MVGSATWMSVHCETQTVHISWYGTLPYFHFYRNFAFSNKHPKLVWGFFSLSTQMLHPFFLPPGCSYSGHTRGTLKIDTKMKSFNRRGGQEHLTYYLVSMYILGLCKVLDYTIVLLLLSKYTLIWWKILEYIQLHNGIYCCFEHVYLCICQTRLFRRKQKSHISRL